MNKIITKTKFITMKKLIVILLVPLLAFGIPKDKEINPIIGKHPSEGWVNTYMTGSLLINY